MAEKVSTLVINVDLECCKSYKKINKVLCQLQDCMNIRSITYDEEKNTVTLSGPFDPHKLSKKLWCKAYKIIILIQIPPQEAPTPPPTPSPLWVCCIRPCPCYHGSCGGRSCCSCGVVFVPCDCTPKVCGKPPSACCSRPCPCYHGSCGGRSCCSCGVVFVPCDCPPKVRGKPPPACCGRPCQSSHGSCGGCSCCSCGTVSVPCSCPSSFCGKSCQGSSHCCSTEQSSSCPIM